MVMASVRRSKEVPVWRGFPQEDSEGVVGLNWGVLVVVMVVLGVSLVPQARAGRGFKVGVGMGGLMGLLGGTRREGYFEWSGVRWIRGTERIVGMRRVMK